MTEPLGGALAAPRSEPTRPDVAALAAALGTALHAAGLPVGPDRCERLARAVTVMGVSSVAELRACALATLVSDPGQMTVFDRVFAALFGAPSPLPGSPPVDPGYQPADASGGPSPAARSQGDPGSWPAGVHVAEGAPAGADGDEPPAEGAAIHRVASAAERLRGRDFTQLSDTELRQLTGLMRELTLAVPPRRTRRYRSARDGKRPDLRRTLRQARRSGGEAIAFARRAPRVKPRRLIVLCDISGSMEPYARALLMLLYCLNGGQLRGGPSRPEVFSFATRLTRLTPALAAASPDTMLAKAGEAAPDWSGGTRIGAAIKEFNDHYGCRGLARGAVVLIISDGWETGEPELLGAQMARLSRVAHRIVWANPRTSSPRYRPEVGGMAAAWPYCDAVVSAHNLDALDELLSALGAR
ncbi:MAG: VWA domain-containing protein [Streptosporangiaceae bacterium]